jgi:hypothetical protein
VRALLQFERDVREGVAVDAAAAAPVSQLLGAVRARAAMRALARARAVPQCAAAVLDELETFGCCDIAGDDEDDDDESATTADVDETRAKSARRSMLSVAARQLAANTACSVRGACVRVR